MSQPFREQAELGPDIGEPTRKPGRNLMGGAIIVLAVASFLSPSEEYIRHQAVNFVEWVAPF